MSKPAVEPLSSRLSWEDAHQLELLIRLRASSLARSAGSRHVCPSAPDRSGRRRCAWAADSSTRAVYPTPDQA